MGKYEVSRQGLQLGLMPLKEISRRLTSGELQWTDYVIEEGANKDWVPLFELGALSEQFKAYGMHVHDSEPKGPKLSVVGAESPMVIAAQVLGTKWFVKTETGEKGPFDYLNIVGRLQEKKIFEFDHVRNSESTEWRQVADTDAFHSSKIRALKETPEAKVLTMFYRRRHARTDFGAQILLHNEKDVWKGRAVEIGQGGAGLLLNSDRVNTGEQLFLHFKSGEGVPPFTAICVIVSKAQTQDGDFRYGVKFTKVSQSVQQAIQNLAKSQAA